MYFPKYFYQIVDTGISQTTINTISKHFCTPPEPWAFELHKGINRILQNREKMVSTCTVLESTPIETIEDV